MKKELEKIVKILAEKAVDAKSSLEAMQYMQAVLNGTHALITLKDIAKR